MRARTDRRRLRVAERDQDFANLALAGGRRTIQCNERQYGAHRRFAASAEADGIEQNPRHNACGSGKVYQRQRGGITDACTDRVGPKGLMQVNRKERKGHKIVTQRRGVRRVWSRSSAKIFTLCSLRLCGELPNQGPWCVAKGLESASSIISRASFSVSSFRTSFDPGSFHRLFSSC